MEKAEIKQVADYLKDLEVRMGFPWDTAKTGLVQSEGVKWRKIDQS